MNKKKRSPIEKRGARRVLRQTAASGLIQNMSCAPTSEIRHRSRFRRPNGRGLIFSLPQGHDPLPGLLKQAGAASLSLSSPESAESALRRRIDAHALTLPLPPAALVTVQAEPEDEACEDLMSIAAVLAKSSGHVYRRDKSPNLNQIKPGRRDVLLVPGERKRR